MDIAIDIDSWVDKQIYIYMVDDIMIHGDRMGHEETPTAPRLHIRTFCARSHMLKTLT